MAVSLENEPILTLKKYPVGCDEDKEKIFCFPFILHSETLSYIKTHAHIMFIIRGPPSTGKATLSEMLTEKYPDAAFCCADRYFTDSFTRATRSRESLTKSHVYCEKKVENACKSSQQTIIVQNTHMRKWEMQKYLDFAAQYNYTVVMAITLYRFDCTPKALAENNTDGLDISYFKNRLRQWEDVLPKFTGWFISPNDSLHILNHTHQAFEALLSDGKFCRVFDVYDMDDTENYFQPKKVLYCLAGFSKNPYFMKKYYLSNEVQAFYGKCFTISIVGFLVSANGVYGIVRLHANMTRLLLKQCGGGNSSSSDLSDMFQSLGIQSYLQEDNCKFPNKDELPSATTVVIEEDKESEKIEASDCSFVCLARKKSTKSDIESLQKEFNFALQSFVDADGFLNLDGCSELEGENGVKVYRLDNDDWLVKPAQNICLQTIFTGFYI